MSRLLIETLPVLKDNYIHVLHEPESGATAAVDPAVAQPVLDLLDRRGWSLTHVLITHHHADHVGGNLDLKAATGAKVVGARSDSHRIPGLDWEVGGKDSFLVGHAAALVLDTPGHTSGHICFWFPDQHALFCGDTLFSLGCGRLFEGSPAQMWDSLQKLRELPDETQIYAAHEYTESNGRFAKLLDRANPDLSERLDQVAALRRQGLPSLPVRLDRERRTNPFLRADHDSMAHAVGLSGGADPVQVFAELRRRKDVF